jgi:hypothetical protein
MDKRHLNAKKVKFTVGMCDNNDPEETELCANEAGMNSMCSTVVIEQLPKIDDGYFPKYWMKGQWHYKLNTYELLTINRVGLSMFTC